MFTLKQLDRMDYDNQKTNKQNKNYCLGGGGGGHRERDRQTVRFSSGCHWSDWSFKT